MKQYYPEVNQFVTLMRDPFEMAVSAYFYLTTRPEYWRNSPIQVPQGTLEEFLLGKNGAKGILRYFPGKLTRFNYQNFLETHFIEVGVLEHLEESMRRIGEKLNKPFDPAMIEVLNPADRSQRVPYELRDAYREKCILPFLMYEYALSRYE